MALINCPECNKEVSDTAKTCPHCGSAINKHSKKKMDPKTKKTLIISCGIILACVIVFFIVNAIFGLNTSEKAQVAVLNNKIAEKMQFELDGKSESELESYKESCDEILKEYEKLKWKQRIKTKGANDFKKRIEGIQEQITQIQSDEVQNVISLIDAIGEVTLDNQIAITEAEVAYEKLDDTQKAQITNINLITEANTKLDELKIANTIDLINHIGKVSLENNSEEDIINAEEAYDSISPSVRKQVNNYSLLRSKRKEYDKLKKYKNLLTRAQENIKNGRLNSAYKKIKKLPSNFKYKGTKAKTLKKQLSSKKAWLSLCGKWKSTGGMMKVYEIWKYDGSSEYWYKKIDKGTEYVSVYCTLLKNGKMKVKITGEIPCYTEYSSIAEYLEIGSISLNKTVTVSSMGTIRINQYTTITLSPSGISVNYYKVNPNESQSYTYKYTSTMNCRKRVYKY